MGDPINDPSSGESAGKFWQANSIVNRRTVGAAVFIGGLVISGASLYQPIEPLETVSLTAGTSGASGETSSGTSGQTSSGASGQTSGGTSGTSSGTSGTSGQSSGTSGGSGETSSGTSGQTSSGASGQTSSGTSGTSGQSSGTTTGAPTPNRFVAFLASIWHATASFIGGLITSFLGLFFGFRRPSG
jgi:hypothetical protein